VAATLKVATGPNSQVTGVRRAAGRRKLVESSTLNPCGANMDPERNGLCPWVTA